MTILMWCLVASVIGVVVMFGSVFGLTVLLLPVADAVQFATWSAIGMAIASPFCCLFGWLGAQGAA